MYADIEQLILSGEFFNGPERSNSPTRTPSPDNWGQDDYESESEANAAAAKNAQIERMLGAPLPDDAAGEPVGMGTGRTGVKGVIRDRDEARERARARGRTGAEEAARRMEKMALTARTWKEDEEAARNEKAREEGRAPSPDEEDGRRDVWGAPKGRFGHLREVGVRGFVEAVEDERGVWVVIHLYDPSLERCYILDDTLARLARLNPNTKFLRARASALGFASTSKSSRPSPLISKSNTVTKSSRRIPGRFDAENSDEDDPYGPGSGSDGEGANDVDEDEVDTDMLPTMLVYRDGDLVHNWVRVDWDAGVAGVEELLTRHHVLSDVSPFGVGNCGLPPDDDLWHSSDDE